GGAARGAPPGPALGGPRHPAPAALDELPQRLVLLGAVPGQLHHHLRVLDGEDEVGGMPGGTARVRHRALVHQDEVAPPQQRQVMHQAVADDARPNDDGAGPGERPPGTPRWPHGPRDFVTGTLAAGPGERPPGTPRWPHGPRDFVTGTLAAGPGERPPGTPRWPHGPRDFVTGTLAAGPGERPPGTPRWPHGPRDFVTGTLAAG